VKLKEDKFIEKNIEKWNALENYNTNLEKRGMLGLKKEEIKEFTDLYRAVSHHLAYARTHFPESNISLYLNQIISVSHNHIFVREKSGISGFKNYFFKGFRKSFNDNFKYIFTSFAVFMLGLILYTIAVIINRSMGDAFFPGIDASSLNLDPTSDQSALYPLFSSFIMTNNIRVCFMSFAFGITAGIGTLYVLFYNGINIGALLGIVIADGANVFKFLAMILPHGFIELTAIFISGGAGLMIGKAMLMPGSYKRKDAVIKASKEAAYLIPGIIVMLIIAGIIEGFFTPLGISYVFKLLFSFGTLLLMYLYFRKKGLYSN